MRKSQDYTCIQCSSTFPVKRGYGPRSTFLCIDCRVKLTRTCSVCGKIITNTSNEIPAKFLKREVCSEDCRKEHIRFRVSGDNNPMKQSVVANKVAVSRQLSFKNGLWTMPPMSQEQKEEHRQRMLKNNPMRNPQTVEKSAAGHRKAHKVDPAIWKEKYRQAKFSHWVKVARGETTIGPQRHGANPVATDFFNILQEALGHEQDTVFYDGR